MTDSSKETAEDLIDISVAIGQDVKELHMKYMENIHPSKEREKFFARMAEVNKHVLSTSITLIYSLYSSLFLNENLSKRRMKSLEKKITETTYALQESILHSLALLEKEEEEESGNPSKEV